MYRVYVFLDDVMAEELCTPTSRLIERGERIIDAITRLQ